MTFSFAERKNRASGRKRETALLASATGRRTIIALLLAGIIPLLLFGASVVFLQAEANRRAARDDVVHTLDRVVDRVTVALQREVEVAEALASLPSLDEPQLERFYQAAQRIVTARALWETVSIADANGVQVMNILRRLGDTLGPVSDRPGFEQALHSKQSVIGGIGPVGPISGKRLVSLSVPIIRNGQVSHVLIVGMSPAEIQRILIRAGAPKNWMGAIIDANGNIIARSQDASGVGSPASEAVRSAIATAPAGEYRGRTPGGVDVDTLYQRVLATNGWTVHFAIPSATLNGPVSRSTIFLVVSCAICILLAGGLAHFTAHDLEERRRESERYSALLLASSEQRAGVAIAAAELGTWRLDQRLSAFSGSERTRDLLHLPAADRRGPDFLWASDMLFEAAHPDDRARLKQAFEGALRSGGLLDIEYRTRNGQDNYRWVRIAGREMPAPDGPQHSFLQGVIADVHELRTSQAERVHLLQRLADAQEEEQRRIARELHDQVGQTLTGLSLGLKSLENEIAAESLRSRVLWLESLTSDISRDIHRVAADLRPVALDDLGIARALSALAADLTLRHSVRFEVQALGLSDRLPANIENAAFRIVQEAFTNALKHAGAKNVSAILERRDGKLRIVVEDDGRGLAPELLAENEEASKAWGDKLGLSTIRERLATLGGTLRLESTPGQGFSLFIDIPLDRPEQS